MNAPAPNADWYCRRGSELLGPVSTARLEQLLAARAIQDHDHVRVGADGAWIPVADIRQLFHAESPAADASHAARNALARAAHAQLAADVGNEPPRLPRKPRFAALGAIADVVAATLGRACGWLLSLIGRWLACRPVRWAIGAALAGAAVWAFATFVVWPRLPLAAVNVLADYRDLWEQVEDARRRNAPDQEWSRLVDRADALALRHAPPLQHQARFRQPVIQELLQATAFLTLAVHDARDGRAESSPAAAKFLIHLQNAERRLAREREIAGELATPAPHPDNLLLAGFLILDGVLLLAAAAFVLRRRWR